MVVLALIGVPARISAWWIEMLVTKILNRRRAIILTLSMLAACAVGWWHASRQNRLPTPVILKGHTDTIEGLAFTRDGRTLVSGSQDRTVRFWDLEQAREEKTHDLSSDLYDLALSYDGRTLATWCWGQDSVSVRDEANEEDLARIAVSGLSERVRQIGFSPNGEMLFVNLASTGTEELQVWDSDGWQLKTKLKVESPLTCQTAFSYEGNTFATARENSGEIMLWDFPSGDERGKLQGHRSTAWSMVFSPDGGLLAVGYVDGTIQLWNVQTQTSHLTLHAKGCVYSLTFSSQGEFLFGATEVVQRNWVGGLPRTFQNVSWINQFSRTRQFSEASLWEVGTGRQLATRITEWISLSSAFSPDGALLAAGRSNGDILLWNVTAYANKDGK